MPYRIKEGQVVILTSEIRSKQAWSRVTPKPTTFKRTVDFTKSELVASPLEEHHREGINPSKFLEYPWGFSVAKKWKDVGDIKEVYAKEVHVVAKAGIPKDANTVVVKGSGTNQYTLELNDKNKAISCTCQGFRFSRSTCKHIKKYNA